MCNYPRILQDFTEGVLGFEVESVSEALTLVFDFETESNAYTKCIVTVHVLCVQFSTIANVVYGICVHDTDGQ